MTPARHWEENWRWAPSTRRSDWPRPWFCHTSTSGGRVPSTEGTMSTTAWCVEPGTGRDDALRLLEFTSPPHRFKTQTILPSETPTEPRVQGSLDAGFQDSYSLLTSTHAHSDLLPFAALLCQEDPAVVVVMLGSCGLGVRFCWMMLRPFNGRPFQQRIYREDPLPQQSKDPTFT